MKKTFLILMIIVSFNNYARTPQGEYSALVENGLTRQDFENEDEMMDYIEKMDTIKKEPQKTEIIDENENEEEEE